ncbi:beta-N-acetylhexosaminidase [Thioclava sp. A2]|uniref:beta-N-acetylhexosaminidase n=1 Tax=Thioclava sp. FCG-A2 TaxID=3080562 RepID=UPI002953730E|nr:beta-N-acetylhexosaminidase [Thioclava sp. A2]MDV7269533.1 beta-N-acetylhexosaminidase [Thioclava sp. A2]
MAQGAAIFGCEGLELTPREAAFFREANPWGFILFARNIDNPQQVARLTSSLREAVGRDAPVLIDQEGGRVQRMRAPHWREWLPPLEQLTAAGDLGTRALWLRYRIIADELRAVGIDVNCAPTCDIAGPLTHPFLQNRCFGTKPEVVIDAARASAEGLLAGGVLPIIKHIPGHGRATADSHKNLPVVEATHAELSASDFAPFKALADLPMGMTAHIRFTALDDAPATQSARMIGLIRDEIGFDGLLMTDDISMEALSGDLTSRTRASLAAGCDLVLHCNGELPEMEAIVAEAGQMGQAAQIRADRALALRKPPETIDIAALEAELGACR